MKLAKAPVNKYSTGVTSKLEFTICNQLVFPQRLIHLLIISFPDSRIIQSVDRHAAIIKNVMSLNAAEQISIYLHGNYVHTIHVNSS
jgi:hypothetical protein